MLNRRRVLAWLGLAPAAVVVAPSLAREVGVTCPSVEAQLAKKGLRDFWAKPDSGPDLMIVDDAKHELIDEFRAAANNPSPERW